MLNDIWNVTCIRLQCGKLKIVTKQNNVFHPARFLTSLYKTQLLPSPKFSNTCLVILVLGTTRSFDHFAPPKISTGCDPGLDYLQPTSTQLVHIKYILGHRNSHYQPNRGNCVQFELPIHTDHCLEFHQILNVEALETASSRRQKSTLVKENLYKVITVWIQCVWENLQIVINSEMQTT